MTTIASWLFFPSGFARNFKNFLEAAFAAQYDRLEAPVFYPVSHGFQNAFRDKYLAFFRLAFKARRRIYGIPERAVFLMPFSAEISYKSFACVDAYSYFERLIGLFAPLESHFLQFLHHLHGRLDRLIRRILYFDRGPEKDHYGVSDKFIYGAAVFKNYRRHFIEIFIKKFADIFRVHIFRHSRETPYIGEHDGYIFFDAAVGLLYFEPGYVPCHFGRNIFVQYGHQYFTLAAYKVIFIERHRGEKDKNGRDGKKAVEQQAVIYEKYEAQKKYGD